MEKVRGYFISAGSARRQCVIGDVICQTLAFPYGRGAAAGGGEGIFPIESVGAIHESPAPVSQSVLHYEKGAVVNCNSTLFFYFSTALRRRGCRR